MTARPVDLARLTFGVWALARPNDVLHLVGNDDGVGLRQRPLPMLDGAVDLAHAASMLGAAKLFPRHRRLALTSAAVAVGFAAADLSEPLR